MLGSVTKIIKRIAQRVSSLTILRLREKDIQVGLHRDFGIAAWQRWSHQLDDCEELFADMENESKLIKCCYYWQDLRVYYGGYHLK